jgi:hypothetical protein
MTRVRWVGALKTTGGRNAMSSNLANFFGAAAQTIPVLLLTLAVETTFLAGALRSKRVEEAAKSGDWAAYVVDALPAAIPVPGVQGLIGGLLERGLRAFGKAFAQPIGVAANAAFVFGSLLVAVIAEAGAFVGLALDVKGTASYVLASIVLVGIGLLLIETFAALILVVLSGGRRDPGAGASTPPPDADSPGSDAIPSS